MSLVTSLWLHLVCVGVFVVGTMAKLQALRDKQLKAFSDKLKSENDAILEKVGPVSSLPGFGIFRSFSPLETDRMNSHRNR